MRCWRHPGLTSWTIWNGFQYPSKMPLLRSLHRPAVGTPVMINNPSEGLVRDGILWISSLAALQNAVQLTNRKQNHLPAFKTSWPPYIQKVDVCFHFSIQRYTKLDNYQTITNFLSAFRSGFSLCKAHRTAFVHSNCERTVVQSVHPATSIAFSPPPWAPYNLPGNASSDFFVCAVTWTFPTRSIPSQPTFRWFEDPWDPFGRKIDYGSSAWPLPTAYQCHKSSTRGEALCRKERQIKWIDWFVSNNHKNTTQRYTPSSSQQ